MSTAELFADTLDAPGDLLGVLRQLIRHEMAQRPTTAIGVIEEVRAHSSDADPGNYDCSVCLQGREVRWRDVPIATNHRGTIAVPQVDDLVLLHFIGGDWQQPIIAGRFYDEHIRPPTFGEQELRTVLPADGQGSTIDLRASLDDGRLVEVLLPDDIALTINDGAIRLSHGDRVLELDTDNGLAAIATGGGRCEITDQGDISLQGDGAITIDASGDLTIKTAANLTLEASGNAVLKGAKVDIN